MLFNKQTLSLAKLQRLSDKMAAAATISTPEKASNRTINAFKVPSLKWPAITSKMLNTKIRGISVSKTVSKDASVALIPVASEPHPSSTDTMAIRTTPSYRTFLPRFFSKTPRHVPRSSNQGEVEDVEPLADSPSSLNASPAPPKSSNRKLRLTLRLPKLSLKKRTTSSPQGDLVVALTEQVPNSPVGEVAPVVSRFTKLSKALCLRKTTTTATSSFLSFKNLNLGFKMPTVSLFKRSIKTSVVPPTQKASPIAFVPAPAHFTEDRHVLNWPKATTTNVERVFLDMTIDDVTEKVNVFIHTPIAPTPSSIKKFSFKLSNLTARPTAAVQALLDMGFSPLKRSS